MTLDEAKQLVKGNILTCKAYPKLIFDCLDNRGWVYCYGFGGIYDFDAVICEAVTKVTCSKPPSGWTCSRQPGHDGPCAASQEPVNLELAEKAYNILEDANPHLPNSLAVIRRVLDELK